MSSAAAPAARPSGRRELWLRVASGLVLGGGVLAALVYGGWAFAGIWLAAGIVGFAEWMVMSRTEPREVLIALGAATLGALLLCERGGARRPPASPCCCSAPRPAPRSPGRRAGGSGPSSACSGRRRSRRCPWPRDDPGIGLVGPAWMFAVVWSTDIAAYFAGRKIGGPKLMPRVSPNKTWSGALGGLLGAVVAGTLVPVLADLAGMPLPSAASLPVVAGVSALASVLSQAGDLVDSGLKRRYGVKDSGKIIPGHGGVMDRLDGFFAVAVLAAVYLALRGGGLIA